MNEEPAPIDEANPKTIEEVFVKKDTVYDLPREEELRPLTRQNRPQTVQTKGNIMTDFSVPYDISYRRDKHTDGFTQKEPFPSDVDPTIVNVVQHFKKPSKSLKRAFAQELTEKLNAYERSSNVDDDEDIISSLQHVQRSITAHKEAMDGFVENSKKFEPERTDLIQKITDHYSSLAKEIPKICETYKDQIDKANSLLDDSQSDHEALKKTKNDLKLSIEKQNRTIFNLKQQIDDYKTKCANTETRLRDATNEKMAIQRSSQSNKDKLKQLTQQIEEKENQTKSIRSMVNVLNTNLEETTKKLEAVSNNLKSLDDQIMSMEEESQKLDKESKEASDELEQLSLETDKSPSKVTRQDASVQVSILQQQIAKERKQQQKVEAAARNEKKKAETGTKEDFKQNKSDMALIQKHFGDTICISTMEDLKQIRELVLQNNHIFNWGATAISHARAGNFSLKTTGNDEARLYANWFVSRAISRAVTCINHADAEVQTESASREDRKRHFTGNKTSRSSKSIASTIPSAIPSTIASTSDLAMIEEEDIKEFVFDEDSQELSVMYKNARLTKLLKTNYSHRKPKDVDWLIHSIRSIYDEKFVDDQTKILELDQYTLKWAFRQFGRDDLIQKGCWDLLISAYYHMQRSLEVMIFVRFLDGVWTLDQLTFFLKSRAWILKRCVSVAIQNESVDEYLMETFMTRSQVSEYFKLFCPDTEPDLVEDINIRSCNCADPKRGSLDDSCIPMMRVLEIAVGEKEAKQIRRLRKMLAKYRIIPRMTSKRFITFIRSLLPNIDVNMIDSLYHSSQVPNSLRTDIDFDKFADRFNSGFDDEEIPDFSQYSPQYALAYTRWEHFHPFLLKIIDQISAIPGDEGKTLVNEIRHNMFQMLEAKVSYDGKLFFETYHKLLQSILFACMRFNLPDSYVFQKQISDFEGRLIEKYNKATNKKKSQEDLTAKPEKEN